MEEKVISLLEGHFKLPTDQVTKDKAMNSVDSWDSLKHMELIPLIEEEFSIELSYDDIINMTSFEKINEIIKSK